MKLLERYVKADPEFCIEFKTNLLKIAILVSGLIGFTGLGLGV